MGEYAGESVSASESSVVVSELSVVVSAWTLSVVVSAGDCTRAFFE